MEDFRVKELAYQGGGCPDYPVFGAYSNTWRISFT